MGTRHWPEDADREVERLKRRIEELEAACSSCYDAQQRAQEEVERLQRKYDALVEGIEIMLNLGACVNLIMENNIRALIEHTEVSP